ncbi:MAG: ATP-binding protein [Planctomycetota bacterium]|nr:ATP-binding protein [Planctomycetota bacterium]
MPEPLPAPFRISVPTDLVFVRPVRKMIEAVLVAQGWGEDDVDDAALVITEIVQNAIEHGSKCDGTESVSVLCAIQAEAVELEVDDPGSGKDPAEVMDRDPSAPVPLDATRGRGLFLIHKLCATFERSVREEGGMRIRVRRECTTG